MSETAASRRPTRLFRLRIRREAPAASGKRVGGAGLFMAALPLLTVANAGVGLLLPAWLGPVEFGRYSLIVTLFQYGLVFDLGLSQLIDRRVPLLLDPAQADRLQKFASQVLWLRLCIAGVILLAGGAALATLRPFGPSGGDLLAGLLSLAAGLGLMLALGPGSIWRARSDRMLFGVVSVAANLVLAIGRPVGIIFGGIVGCFLCLAIAYGVMAAWVYARMPPSMHDMVRPRAALGLLVGGMPLFLVAAIWAVYMTANRWVLSAVASPMELGEFAFASNVTCLVVGAVSGLSQFYYPRVIAQHDAAQAYASSRGLFGSHARLLGAMVVMTAAGLLAGPGFIGLFYTKYIAAVPAMQALLLAVPGLVLFSWLMPVSLSLSVRPWIDGLVVNPLGLVALVACTYVGYRWHGLVGAGFGLVVSAWALLALQLASLRYARVLRTSHAVLLALGVAAGAAVLVPPMLAGPAIGARITHLWNKHAAPVR